MNTRQQVVSKSQQVRQFIRKELETLQGECLKYYHVLNQLAHLQFIRKEPLQQELRHIETRMRNIIRQAKTPSGDYLFVFDNDSYRDDYFLWCCYNFENSSDCKTLKLTKLRLLLDQNHPEYLFREPITTYPKYSQEYYQFVINQIQSLFDKITQYKDSL